MNDGEDMIVNNHNVKPSISFYVDYDKALSQLSARFTNAVEWYGSDNVVWLKEKSKFVILHSTTGKALISYRIDEYNLDDQ